VSVRREEDESRRKAMHELVTRWDKAARTTAKDLVDHLFRGRKFNSPLVRVSNPNLAVNDIQSMMKMFHSLIPDAVDEISSPLFQPSIEVRKIGTPVQSIGGYSITETVGPLSMLTQVIRSREIVTIWLKERVTYSHGKRKVRISKLEAQIVLFDRYMNIVYIPRGFASDRWQMIRGSMVALIQRPVRR
jgi:hypothetical protein